MLRGSGEKVIKARILGSGFKLFYHGVDGKKNGVVVRKKGRVCYECSGSEKSIRVMSLKIEIEGMMFNVVSGDALKVGCELEEENSELR